MTNLISMTRRDLNPLPLGGLDGLDGLDEPKESPQPTKIVSAHAQDPALTALVQRILNATNPLAAYVTLPEGKTKRIVAMELFNKYRTSPTDPKLVAFMRGLINHKQSNVEEKSGAIEALAENINPKAPPPWFKTELETLLKTDPRSFNGLSAVNPRTLAAKVMQQLPGGEAFS